MNLNTDDLRMMIVAIAARIKANTAELNHLDAALGDGDHGTGIATGFEAAAEAVQPAESPADVLKITATTLMNRMGGSSGALYGTLFLRMALTVKDAEAVSDTMFADMWLAGCAGVIQRGKSAVGDKTMLDALSPAVDALKQSIDAGNTLHDALALAATAAENGANATINLQAKHGRARYIGERAIGHMDAGSKSVALMFAAMHEDWKVGQDGEA